jgi:hypothetical protein
MAFGNLKVDTITSSTRTINVDNILAGGDGSAVTFIAASGDAPLSVSGSPVTSSGTLTISLDQSALSIAPSQLASGALPSGVTVASVNIANGTIVNEDISDSASIDPAKISGVAVVSGDVRLSDERTPIDESVTNAKVASGAAIELSKLATGPLPSGITIASTNITDGAIVDADINDSAAITLTKLASGTLPSGIAIASGTDASTNLSYDDSTRVLSSSTGSSATLPLVTSSTAGLQPASGYDAITYAAQVTLDFAALDKQMNTISLTGDLELLTSNLANGREVRLRLVNDASQRTLTFPADWKFVGAKPANIAASKVAILSLAAFGTANTDVVAAYAVQP